MSDWPIRCAAVISCFNEAGRVGAVVTGVRRHLPGVIVIDDGSRDATADVARANGAMVIQLPQNIGKGAALRHGWARASAEGFSWTLMLDGDGQHATDDIPRFLDCAEQTDARLVVGNRMGSAETMPWIRRKVNAWMSQKISSLTHSTLPDSQCGFRLAHLPTLLSLELRTDHFEVESEMLAAFLQQNQRVEFVHTRTIYHAGPSRIRPMVDAWRWWRWWRTQQVPPTKAPLWNRPQHDPIS